MTTKRMHLFLAIATSQTLAGCMATVVPNVNANAMAELQGNLGQTYGGQGRPASTTPQGPTQPATASAPSNPGRPSAPLQTQPASAPAPQPAAPTTTTTTTSTSTIITEIRADGCSNVATGNSVIVTDRNCTSN